MAQMGDESEDETPDNEEDDGKDFLLSDDSKDIDLRSALNLTAPAPVCELRMSELCRTHGAPVRAGQSHGIPVGWLPWHT